MYRLKKYYKQQICQLLPLSHDVVNLIIDKTAKFSLLFSMRWEDNPNPWNPLKNSVSLIPYRAWWNLHWCW